MRSDTAQDVRDADAARLARRMREQAATPAERLVRLDALIRELALLRGAARR